MKCICSDHWRELNEARADRPSSHSSHCQQFNAAPAGTTAGVLRQLGELPPTACDLMVRGAFRVYFNRHQAAPLVWCIATDSLEIAVSQLTIEATSRTVYAPKPTPDDEDGRPSAWLEVAGVLVIRGKDARITRSAE